MSIQTIWKRLTKIDAPWSVAMSLLRPLPFNEKPHFKFPNFCTQIAGPFTTPHRGVAAEFLIKKCGLTAEDIAKVFRHCNHFLRAKSSQNLEEVLELLNGCGLTAREQIRRVVISNPGFLFLKAERNLKAFRDFMKKEDVDKLVYRDTWIFTSSERRLKSAFSLLQELGIEGEALSDLVARVPRLLLTSEERIVESFKQAECFGFKKGSIMFAIAVRAIFQTGKENLDRKLQCLSSLGFSEKQISDLIRRNPVVVCLSEEKLKCNVDFIVKTVRLPLADIEKYPCLLDCSLETRMIPRYRVLEALKSMQVHLSKRGICFPKIIQLTEKRFLEKYVKYVNLNAESSPVLQDIYYGGKAGKLIIDKETCSERITFFSSQRSFLWPENPSQGVLR